MLIDFSPYKDYAELAELGAEGMDELALQHIGVKVLEPELELMKTKWVDYRTIHPAEATFLFCELYKQIYSEVLHRRVDYQRAPHMTGIKKLPFYYQAPKTMTGLWKARQTADRYGIPYDFFIRHMLLLTEKRGRKHLARPEQMYQKELLEIVVNKWWGYLNSNLVHSKHPYFSAENYQGDELQRYHVHFLFAQVDRLVNKDLALYSLIKRKGLIRELDARQKYPQSLVDKALSIDL